MRLAKLNFSEVASSSYYSEGLRLRPNYLIYALDAELSEDQRRYLETNKVPWAEYAHASIFAALISLLKSFSGGIYMPQLTNELGVKQDKVCIFLLDPHLIDEFENKISKNRLGVLIRRPIVASFDFQETIDLTKEQA